MATYFCSKDKIVLTHSSWTGQLKQYAEDKTIRCGKAIYKWIRVRCVGNIEFVKRLKHHNIKVKVMLKILGCKDIKQHNR